MIVYAIVLLTDLADIRKAKRIYVRYGTTRHSIDADVVRDFVKCTNHAYHDFPYGNCLEYGLLLVPPVMRPVFEYLYETLREVFVWNEPENTFE